jgi:hypothetical protein
MASPTSSSSTLGWPGRVAVGVVHGDPPLVYLAESDAVLGRLLALRVVARSQPENLDAADLDEIREALTDQRWADAVATWMRATGDVLDAYPDEEVTTEEMLDAERAAAEIRRSPIFRSGPGGEP